MYCIEGDVTTRRRPESFIGDYGLHQVVAIPDDFAVVTHTFSATGPREFVMDSAREWQAEGLPAEAPIELISTVGAAEKYATPKTESVVLESPEEPNLIDAVTSLVLTDRELLAACISLWREKRRPSPKRYTSAEGTLLAMVEFDQEVGWRHQHQRVAGHRKVSGLVTPRVRRTTTVTHIETVDRIDNQVLRETIDKTEKLESANIAIRLGKA